MVLAAVALTIALPTSQLGRFILVVISQLGHGPRRADGDAPHDS